MSGSEDDTREVRGTYLQYKNVALVNTAFSFCKGGLPPTTIYGICSRKDFIEIDQTPTR